MSELNRIVNLLSSNVVGISPVSEAEIQRFAKEYNILLRDDHLHFLMKFGCGAKGRLQIFKSYQGDFDFRMFRAVYLENSPEMAPPEGCAYFGSRFMDESFCIDYESGKIYAFEEGDRYGLVHESIDGFLINCLLIDDYEIAFSDVEIEHNLGLDFIDKFRLKNEALKLNEASRFEGDRGNSIPITEFYLIENSLIKLFFPTGTMIEFRGVF